MRLDKYLKVSRLIKRRTVANDACDAGRVMINDKVAKASVDVKVGDIIDISFGNKNVKVRVTDVKDTVKKEEAKLSVRMHSIAYISPFLQVLSARHMLSEKVSSYFDDTFFTVCKLMSCVGCQHNNSSKHISCTYYRAYRLLPALIIRHN